MKIRRQIKNILLLNICFLTLVGCASSEGGKNPPSQNEGEDNNPPFESPNSEVTNIFFSELYVGESVNDAILEIGTTSKEPISLRGYKVNFYGGKNLAYSYTFEDEIISKDKLVLFVNLESEFIDETSTIIKLEDNYVCGRYYVELLDRNDKYIDKMGMKGFNLEYIDEGSLVRLKEYQIATHEYEKLNFIKVRLGVKDYLGNLEAPLTLETLLTGPRLDESTYGDLLFANGSDAMGGYTEVTVSSLGDGDTTYFNYSESSGHPGRYSTRYLLIDTPEVDHGPNSNIKEEPRGNAAKKFNNDILKKATSIIVQSNASYALNETYGRLLGYVWYTVDPNKSLESYRLLNFELTKAGLCEFSQYDTYVTMHSNDIYYYNYLEYVYQIAKRDKIKIHGEVDPDYRK